MAQQVLNLDRNVVRQARMLGVQGFHDGLRVSGAVEKIGVAKRNMFRAGGHLLPHILNHDFARHHSKRAVVDGHDGTVPAEMFASAARLGRSRQFLLPVHE